MLLVATWHVRRGALQSWNGRSGVLLFFVLSGFLITNLALREEDDRGRVDLRAFYIRRSARILPLYYLALGAYCLAVLVFHLDNRTTLFVEALPFYLLFAQEVPVFSFGDRPFALSWSLGIEEKFYLFWPIVGFGLLRRWRARVILAGTLVVICLVVGASWTNGAYVMPYVFILGGVLLALALRSDPVAERFQLLVAPAISVAAALVVAVLAVWGDDGSWSFALSFSAASCVLLLSLIAGSGPIANLLSRPPLRWIGRISYAVYLFHQIGLHIAERIVPERLGRSGDYLTLLLGLAITLPTCELLGRVFERPLIRWARLRAHRSTVVPDE